MMIKKLVPFILVSAIVLILFLGFMYFIGVPKTRARNFYNLALEAEKNGDQQKEREYLNTAKSYWAEDYILKKINELNL